MDSSRLHAFARRRLADNPDACPIEPEDAALMMIWLASLETEAELNQAEVDRLLAEGDAERRAAMAAGFRAASGRATSGNGNGNGNGGRREQRPAVEPVEEE